MSPFLTLNIRNQWTSIECCVVVNVPNSIYRTASMPSQAFNASMKELKRLKKMPQQMPEHSMIRSVTTFYNDMAIVLLPQATLFGTASLFGTL